MRSLGCPASWLTRDAERVGEADRHREHGLLLAALVAPDLAQVDAGVRASSALREPEVLRAGGG